VKLAIRRTYFGDRLCFPDISPGRLVDVQASYAWQLERRGAGRDDALERSQREIPSELPALLRADPALAVVRRVRDQVADGHGLPDGCTWPASESLLGPPVGHPATIWDMSSNYPRQRMDAATQDRPEDPPPLSGYLKAAGSLAGPYDDLVYPAISDHVAPEMELAVVIGRRSRGLDTGTAMDAVAGYVGFCDVGARDVSAADGRRADRSKGFETFSIVGPWFVTADEVPDPHGLRIRYWVNGELRQDGSTGEMFHTIPEQLAWLTSALTLSPGDVVATGTPAGVSSVRPGDELRGEIEGLGVIASRVIRAG
jgi:2-keto-4-pentenoate hydratase/2-oxohepta-3-ene-1,7-dioic acid hydratase in catechol pathway